MRFFRTITVAGALLACAAGAGAQSGVSMLNPLAPSYNLLSFVYEPPKGEGWRELGAAPDSVRIIYAEQLAETQINTRADFTVQAFEIGTTEKVQLPDLATLTRMSMAQRIKEKKDEGTELVAMSQPQQLSGDIPVFEYTLVVKVGAEDVFEDYFVALAPNKSEYLAGKMVTKDKEFREQSYFKALHDSVTKLKFPSSAAAVPEPAQDNAEPAKNADSENVKP